MAPKIDKGTIIILDVGKNTAELDENKKVTFFESARSCAMRFIEHKITSQLKNLLGIILLGSRKTENVLAAETSGTCRYIEMVAELQPPNWQMIRNLPENPSKVSGEWFDALLVAAEHFKNGTTSNIINKQIIIISNFSASSNLEESDIKQAIHGFQEEGIEISVLGPDIYDESNCNNDIDLIRQFVEFTNGAAATLEQTLGLHLLFHRKRIVNAVPWNVDLSIGPNVKIPVSSYIRIKDDPVIKGWVKAVRDPVTQSISATESIEKRKQFINTENETIIKIKGDNEEKVIKGYVYGGQVIPFSEFDKSMLYDAGQKSLILYGFTKSSNITNQNLNGDGLSYVFGRKGDKKAEYAIRCLVECLLELELVGIVRRVYNNGNAPKMFVLMPVVDANNFVCLSMAAICFKNEIKNMSFPVTNTKKYECTDKQVNAFKELIKAMELSRVNNENNIEDADAFPILKMCSPSAQYVLDCIAFRALNIDKPLPAPRDEIMRLLNVIPQIEKRAKDPLEKLKKLFILNKIEIKKRGKKADQPMDVDEPLEQSTSEIKDVAMKDIPKINLSIFKKLDVQRVGTVKPIEDFEHLKHKLNVNESYSQLAEAIESIFFCSIDNNFTKALDAMSYFRTECVKSEPLHYNNWLKKFKMILTDRKRHNIIDAINEKKLSYILANENSLSDITSEMSTESQIYENDTVPNLTEVSISSEVDDLFDNM